jgi:hypothetical protein
VSLDPDCFMCTGEWCLRCSPVGDHCEHDFMDRHIDTDGDMDFRRHLRGVLCRRIVGL